MQPDIKIEVHAHAVNCLIDVALCGDETPWIVESSSNVALDVATSNGERVSADLLPSGLPNLHHSPSDHVDRSKHSS
jgi:hypothetical protein